MKIIETSKDAIKKTGLHRPVLKLVSSKHRRRDAVTKRVVDEITKRGFEKVREKHIKGDPSSGKYLDLPRYVSQVVGDAERLDLLDTAPIRVLDIGCGAGYFLYTLKSLGHDVLGMDLAETPLYNDMTKFLGIPRIEHRIVKFQPLPDLKKQLDLITAYAIVFDLHQTPAVWGADAWLYFIEDCGKRLRPGGRVFLNFNPGTNPEYRFISPDVAKALRALPGAKLSSSNEFFTWTKPV